MTKGFLLRCSHGRMYICLVRVLSGYTSGLVSSLASGDGDVRAIEARAEDGKRALYVRQRCEGEQGQHSLLALSSGIPAKVYSCGNPNGATFDRSESLYIEVLVLIRSMVYWALPVRESSRGNWNGVGVYTNIFDVGFVAGRYHCFVFDVQGNSLRHKTVIIDKYSKSNPSLVQQLDPTLHGTNNTIQQFRISPMQPLGSQVYHAAKLDFAQTL
ncbi:hypothetical protein B0H16DRAFT_1456195 [Mycena metata]|uniref:Uncharacterized protein n=1 Tax=Mycena metata TaxID=1033252 RepID=A0AAD7JE58_9AGAR|nr:hypothetical protein B0H16DRAFT_1456195 [Mycena metata]